LKEIENILKAEQKRRVESNEIMNEYIISYMEQLERSLNERFDRQLSQVKERVEEIDGHMRKVEEELEEQEGNIKHII
jgi:tetrahydromethanopterin S-methyltransferase subunit A